MRSSMLNSINFIVLVYFLCCTGKDVSDLVVDVAFRLLPHGYSDVFMHIIIESFHFTFLLLWRPSGLWRPNVPVFC